MYFLPLHKTSQSGTNPPSHSCHLQHWNQIWTKILFWGGFLKSTNFSCRFILQTYTSWFKIYKPWNHVKSSKPLLEINLSTIHHLLHTPPSFSVLFHHLSSLSLCWSTRPGNMNRVDRGNDKEQYDNSHASLWTLYPYLNSVRWWDWIFF